MKRRTSILEVASRRDSVSLPAFHSSGAGIGETNGELPLAQIRTDPNQPRKHFDTEKLGTLAESIKRVGLLQPIVVSPDGSGGYVLVSGERRLRAARLAGWTTIRVEIKKVDELDPRDIPGARLIENLEREDLSHQEEAYSVANLVSIYGAQKYVASLVSRSEAWVSTKVKHAELIQQCPEASKLDSTSASRIMAHSSNAEERKKLIREILKDSGGKNLRELVRDATGGKSDKKKGGKSKTEAGRVSLSARLEKLSRDAVKAPARERRLFIGRLETVLRQLKRL